MYLRTIGRRFTQKTAYFLVMNSKRCTLRLRCLQWGFLAVSGRYWQVRDWRHRTSKMRITWTCTLRLRCLQWGSRAVSGRYWQERDWRHWTTKMRITWTCTLRLGCLQWGSPTVSSRMERYWNWSCGSRIVWRHVLSTWASVPLKKGPKTEYSKSVPRNQTKRVISC